MATRIFYIVMGLAAAFLLLEIYQLTTARTALDDVEPGYGIMPENADLTVVEFLDYSCHYCREVHPAIMEAVRRDGRVRYIPRPVSTNTEAAYAVFLVYSAGRQGKFMEAHNELMENYRAIDEEFVDDFAAQFNLNKDEFPAYIDDIRKQLTENTRMYKNMGAAGTPAFAIGDTVFFTPQGQMPGTEDFLQMFEEARAAQG